MPTLTYSPNTNGVNSLFHQCQFLCPQNTLLALGCLCCWAHCPVTQRFAPPPDTLACGAALTALWPLSGAPAGWALMRMHCTCPAAGKGTRSKRCILTRRVPYPAQNAWTMENSSGRGALRKQGRLPASSCAGFWKASPPARQRRPSLPAGRASSLLCIM